MDIKANIFEQFRNNLARTRFSVKVLQQNCQKNKIKFREKKSACFQNRNVSEN